MAVGVPEPNLTRLHIAATVAVPVRAAAPFTINTAEAVAELVALSALLLSLTLTIVEAGTTVAVAVKGAELSLTLEPLPVLVAVVTEVPLSRTEPSAILLAKTLIVAVPSNVALPILIFSAVHATVDVTDTVADAFNVANAEALIEALALTAAAPSNTSPVLKAKLP